MIVVENLTMKFGDDIILQDVSFEVFRGNFRYCRRERLRKVNPLKKHDWTLQTHSG